MNRFINVVTDFTKFYVKKTNALMRSSLEAPPRFELGVRVLQTRALPLGYGADCGIFRKKNGAGNGIRTRDIHLGKVTLYH